VSKEKTYHRNGETITFTTHTLHFPGVYIDDYIDTIAYCPDCGRQLDGNGTITNELRHLPIGDSYTTLDISRRRLRCLNPKCRYFYDCPIDFKAPGHRITEQLSCYTQELLARHLPLKTVALLTGLNKNVVKEIDHERLKTLYTVKGEGKVFLKSPRLVPHRETVWKNPVLKIGNSEMKFETELCANSVLYFDGRKCTVTDYEGYILDEPAFEGTVVCAAGENKVSLSHEGEDQGVRARISINLRGEKLQ
jgi:hypothetical protein